ncbi:hypothetical protein ERHA54_41660 [Erwinia rhapontici]|uniref:Uncharacterized protein n=1 Tax=Erwinia rhapontici TaxID=55212 RepID=A0ABM7N561_ERWRD|nr:hypothetical protein [Erwinia rhapontici]MCS3608027.1 hypothetical protein [Erwinia rhapontici]TDT00486.1 hypothetical protein EDF84_102210 [Erwinia rhapontici]BCQ36566.1 hypothetical protein ERHA53_39090 [Erwinia rhapontici]BCQ41563.1 hypothetical protein ERHA54_41660 [Erwinia rhapontici]
MKNKEQENANIRQAKDVKKAARSGFLGTLITTYSAQ